MKFHRIVCDELHELYTSMKEEEITMQSRCEVGDKYRSCVPEYVRTARREGWVYRTSSGSPQQRGREERSEGPTPG